MLSVTILSVAASMLQQAPAPSDLTPSADISWRSCSEDAVAAPGAPECSQVEMPARHGELGGAAISIGVMRIPSSDTSATQLWFLDGGPGDAGTAALPRVREALGGAAGTDLYTLDHRGVGASARLGCPGEEAPDSREGREIVAEEWEACIAHIRQNRVDLPYLTVDQTAHDLARLIDITREPHTRVVILGVSYGTFLANRYLQLYPHQADAVILDGIVPPDWTFTEFDKRLNGTGRRLLDLCAADAGCTAHLGSDPQATTSSLFDRLDAGHCGRLGVRSDLMRILLGNLLMVEAIPAAYIPALITRFDRCNSWDELAIVNLFRVLNNSDLAVEAESHSPVLQRHVALSEMWDPEGSDSLLTAALENYLMTTGVSASFGATYDPWPRYRAVTPKGLARFQGPMLMLHGGMDPTMGIERLDALRENFEAPGQTFAFFPHGSHVALTERRLFPGETPTDGEQCARQLYIDFLDDPERPVDTSCISTIPPISFRGDERVTQYLFGTSDLWGDRIPLGKRLLFLLFYRALAWAAVLGVGVLVIVRARQQDQSIRIGRGTAALSVFALLTFIAWQAGLLAPLLWDYRSMPAVLVVAGIAAVQFGAGSLLARWSVR